MEGDESRGGVRGVEGGFLGELDNGCRGLRGVSRSYGRVVVVIQEAGSESGDDLREDHSKQGLGRRSDVAERSNSTAEEQVPASGIDMTVDVLKDPVVALLEVRRRRVVFSGRKSDLQL